LQIPEVFAKPQRALAHADKVMRELLLDKIRVNEVFKGRKLIAIKVHIGERGNRTYVHPTYVAAAVNLLRNLGCEVFVTDTTTLYVGPRNNGVSCARVAYENGFTPETIGAPFIVADGILGEDGVNYRFEKVGLTISIARAIHEADALLVISHAKGHGMSGFGGALKNLAMGCVTKNTKKYQHDPYKPILIRPELCDGCGECVKACLQEAVYLSNGRPVFRDELCIRCGGCIIKCPTKALSVAEGALEEFNIRLGRVAAAFVSYLREHDKPAVYVSVAENITKFCDCVPSPNEIIARDVGVFASLDPVAIDAASINIISGALYPEYKSLFDVNNVDPWIHVKEASKFGAGSLQYHLRFV